jgi:hypothetical protein
MPRPGIVKFLKFKIVMRWYLRQEARTHADGVNFLAKGQRFMKSIQQIKHMEGEIPVTRNFGFWIRIPHGPADQRSGRLDIFRKLRFC